MKSLFIKLLMVTAALFILAGCSKQQETVTVNSLSELNGLDMGCMSGSIFDALIEEQFPDSEIIYFNSRSELLLGVQTGKIAGFISDEPVAMLMCNQNPGVRYLPDAVGSVEYGICFAENAKDKLAEFNAFLKKCEESGHLKELQDKWIRPDGNQQRIADYSLSGTNGTLQCVTTPDAAPFSFMADNIFHGYEVELLTEFCQEYGYSLEISTVSFDALLTSVAMNKYDIAFNGIYITPERAKKVNFTTPTYKANDVVMVASESDAANKDIITTIKDSFYKNFIEEDRYLLLLKGALTTVIISVFSIVLGSFYGLLVYMLSVVSKTFRKIADLAQRILAKLPAVVILMLLFYVIFKTSKVDAVIISIIGFTFIFGHIFYGLLKSGVRAVDIGQFEASSALGYERWMAFFRVILPQALKTILETYLSEIIALIKNTSIVGYVSVNDITRASDIIRGRTYDAFFPLLVTAFNYYLICTLLVELIRIPLKKYIEHKESYDDSL